MLDIQYETGTGFLERSHKDGGYQLSVPGRHPVMILDKQTVIESGFKPDIERLVQNREALLGTGEHNPGDGDTVSIIMINRKPVHLTEHAAVRYRRNQTNETPQQTFDIEYADACRAIQSALYSEGLIHLPENSTQFHFVDSTLLNHALGTIHEHRRYSLPTPSEVSRGTHEGNVIGDDASGDRQTEDASSAKISLNNIGNPPALPGDSAKFDFSGSIFPAL
jgi:hypothetical protein